MEKYCYNLFSAPTFNIFTGSELGGLSAELHFFICDLYAICEVEWIITSMFRSSWNIDVSVDECFRHVYINSITIYRSTTWSYVSTEPVSGQLTPRGRDTTRFFSWVPKLWWIILLINNTYPHLLSVLQNISDKSWMYIFGWPLNSWTKNRKLLIYFDINLFVKIRLVFMG